MKSWVEKYRPQKLTELIGQEEAVGEVENYLETFPNVRRKALLLNGPPGIGKTTLVHVFAKENEYEIFELNASDLRNKKSMIEKLKPVLEQSSLFNKNKLILVDEIDGLSGTKDRGGVSELVSLIEDTKFPIICAANDAWIQKLSPLRKKVNIIELKDITPAETKNLLKKILEQEKKSINEKVLNQISIKARGDLRSAINDLEAAASMENPEEIFIDERNKKLDIFKAMRHIFQDKANKEMLGTFDKVDMQMDEIILWFEENIPKAYSGEDLAKAYQRLAKVDLFKGRIYKQQYWRFLVYENIFGSYGISQAKGDKEITEFKKYSKPTRILKIWLNNQKHGKKKTIAIKYAKKTHVGYKRIMAQWNEIKHQLKNPMIQKELKLDDDEINYIMKY
ncbi:MAG TPA: replication factor C large subunit [Candidatus Nanoarchaeia archaeon]|nr:replication factor C large subunit [Candidatus Nanoarchaeia archaeon]